MDRKYKSHFERLLKEIMKVRHPDFSLLRIPKDAPYRVYAVGCQTYWKKLGDGRRLWIEFEPEDGVGRMVFVSLGWTLADAPYPANNWGNEKRLLTESEALPIVGISGAFVNIQELEGMSAITGFRIASPWDEWSKLPLSVSKKEDQRVGYQCALAEAALSDGDREAATAAMLDEALRRLECLLPRFAEKVLALPDYVPIAGEVTWNMRTHRYE